MREVHNNQITRITRVQALGEITIFLHSIRFHSFQSIKLDLNVNVTHNLRDLLSACSAS